MLHRTLLGLLDSGPQEVTQNLDLKRKGVSKAAIEEFRAQGEMWGGGGGGGRKKKETKR